MLTRKSFLSGSAKVGRTTNGGRTFALFKKAEKQVKKAAGQGKQTAKKASKSSPKKPGTQQIKKAQAPIRKNFPAPKGTRSTQKYGKQEQQDQLWLPNTERPGWLDGSMPGDRGFDPLGLAKPQEYLQFGSDQLDQNKAVNKAGQLAGKFTNTVKSDANDSLAPYDDVFGLERFRETELIHGRWAMLAALGVLIGEASTGVSWVDAGKVELDGAQYLGFRIPLSITALVWIEAILVGGAEIYRNGERDPEKRVYPGGAFDPLGLASENDAKAFRLKTAEIKHGRLAMVAFLGFGVQALVTGQGALGSLAQFSNTFGIDAEEIVEAVEKAI